MSAMVRAALALLRLQSLTQRHETEHNARVGCAHPRGGRHRRDQAPGHVELVIAGEDDLAELFPGVTPGDQGAAEQIEPGLARPHLLPQIGGGVAVGVGRVAGAAGMAAVDTAGQVLAPFNTLGMARGWIGTDGVIHVATHKDVHRIGPA